MTLAATVAVIARSVVRPLSHVGVIVAIAVVANPAASVPADVQRPRVAVVELRDTVQPASLRYLERALDQASADGAELVVIELDTPGGLFESLRAMVSAILASDVPVAIYVSPSGARAASAGFFLLLAADVAAMAPGTNTGAAHPVMVGPGNEEEQSAAVDKAVEDASALARSLAQARHRSIEAARAAVHDSKSFTAEEAREQGLIDLVARDRASLIRELDGRTITRFDGSRDRLQLANADIVAVERTFPERVLSVLASPQLAYLLLMLGAIGVLVELTSPGLIVPGVAGALAILLGLYGLSILPVSLVGALLILAGLTLIVVEVFVTSYGALAIAGIASFVVGSLILVDAPLPAMRIGPAVVVPVAVALVLVSAFLALRAARTRKAHVHSGIEAMLGERGVVVAPIAPPQTGKVFVHGEYWNATSREPVAEGRPVKVEAVDGMQLRVSPVDQPSSGGPP